MNPCGTGSAYTLHVSDLINHTRSDFDVIPDEKQVNKSFKNTDHIDSGRFLSDSGSDIVNRPFTNRIYYGRILFYGN